MIPATSLRDAGWLNQVTQSLASSGVITVADFLSPDEVKRTRDHLLSAQKIILDTYGSERLKAANEVGILRVMMKHDLYFASLLARPEMLAIVDAVVSSTAILHVQTGILLPTKAESFTGQTFQFQFHRDFPRYLNGFVGAVDVMIAIDDFSKGSGGTRMVVGSHQKPDIPSPADLEARSEGVECAAGTAIVFDSTLWHASGLNTSGKDRLAVNHIFTRSYFKPQFDYVRLLGEETVAKLPARTQQLLGYYTRVPSSFDEYYRPSDQRLYRSGQG